MFIPLVHVILPLVTLEADQDTGTAAGMATKLLHFFIFFKRLT